MAVAVVVLNILGAVDLQTQALLLGIGLACLAIAALDNEKESATGAGLALYAPELFSLGGWINGYRQQRYAHRHSADRSYLRKACCPRTS